MRIQGGWDPENAPMCPETCEITLEGRLVPGHSVEAFWKEVRSVIAKLQRTVPGFHAKIEVLEKRPAYSIKENHPLVQTVIDAYKQVVGKAPLMNPMRYPINATADPHYFAAEGIPCVTFGPAELERGNDAKQMFIENESLSVSKIVDTTKILALAIARYLT